MFTSFFYRNPQQEYSQSIVPFFTEKSNTNDIVKNIINQTDAGHHKIGFDDVLYIIKRLHGSTGAGNVPDLKKCPYLLLNTMSIMDQDYLIKYTLSYQMEESVINSIIENYRIPLHEYTIFLYGKNDVDDSVDKKFIQLKKLGFTNIFIYYGGLFEWCLLQDIYGEDSFPTEGKKKDLLQIAPKSKFKNLH